MTRVCWNGYFDRALNRLISLTARCADTNMAIQTDRTRIVHHGDNPNIISIDDGDYFETTRDILANEELLIDYGTIVEDSE